MISPLWRDLHNAPQKGIYVAQYYYCATLSGAQGFSAPFRAPDKRHPELLGTQSIEACFLNDLVSQHPVSASTQSLTLNTTAFLDACVLPKSWVEMTGFKRIQHRLLGSSGIASRIEFFVARYAPSDLRARG
ncbi:MAG: hypothetical protein ACYCS1_02065 [Gammaproteobacteria bacterium]